MVLAVCHLALRRGRVRGSAMKTVLTVASLCYADHCPSLFRQSRFRSYAMLAVLLALLALLALPALPAPAAAQPLQPGQTVIGALDAGSPVWEDRYVAVYEAAFREGEALRIQVESEDFEPFVLL